jgi:hypothetical protein
MRLITSERLSLKSGVFSVVVETSRSNSLKVEVACFWEGKFWNHRHKPMWERLENVTHWMPLPKPPREGK